MNNLIVTVSEWIGMIAFAAAGAIVAIDNGLDAFGVILLGGVTAFGGGVLRDVMLGHYPLWMFSSYGYLTGVSAVSLCLFLYAYFARDSYKKYRVKFDQVINIFDAIGLATFTVAGAQITIDAGYGNNWFMVIFLATTTAIGGGMLRDVLINGVPFVLCKRFYALVAVFGALFYRLLIYLEVNRTVTAVVAAVGIVVLRVLATVFRWKLPHIDWKKE